ncbi:uncharacterized protein BJX67DRAFT_385857 [Aspergillus lucknowensis]|uniref:C2H2-type domain-containing protein n=1 Tax=Aspergillus lucknowensis TaxID=176173 RepID=A0ABR4LCH5_9EURO
MSFPCGCPQTSRSLCQHGYALLAADASQHTPHSEYRAHHPSTLPLIPFESSQPYNLTVEHPTHAYHEVPMAAYLPPCHTLAAPWHTNNSSFQPTHHGFHSQPVHPTTSANVSPDIPLPETSRAIPGADGQPETAALKCEWKGCTYAGGFTRTADLKRHIDTKHLDPQFECPKPGCQMRYSRKDKVGEHVRRAHPEYANAIPSPRSPS